MEFESQEAFWEQRFLVAVPEFQFTYDDHMALHGEALTTLLMSDLLSFVAEHLARCNGVADDRERAHTLRLLRGQRSRRPEHVAEDIVESAGIVRRSLACLEDSVLDGSEIRLEESIMVSFLEHLDTIKTAVREILIALMGPNLRSDLAEVNRYLVDVRNRDVDYVPMYGLKDRRRFAREARQKRDVRDIPKNWLAEVDR